MTKVVDKDRSDGTNMNKFNVPFHFVQAIWNVTEFDCRLRTTIVLQVPTRSIGSPHPPWTTTPVVALYSYRLIPAHCLLRRP